MSRTIIGFVVLATLITAFVLPARFFEQFGNTMINETHTVMEALEQADTGRANRGMQNLIAEFEQGQNILRYLVDHEEVDKMNISLKKAARAISLDAVEEALIELEELLVMLEYIPQIENVNLVNIF